MIHNQFIKELDIKFDYEKLKDISLESRVMPGGNKHQRLVSDNSYLSAIRERYPFFSPVYNILQLEHNQQIPPHVDADRFCALNIPLSNTRDSYTIFYDLHHPIALEYDQLRIAYMVKSDMTECFRFSLTYPTLINNGDKNYAHGVIHTGTEKRIIISWSLLKSTNFTDACKFFNDDVVSGIGL